MKSLRLLTLLFLFFNFPQVFSQDLLESTSLAQDVLADSGESFGSLEDSLTCHQRLEGLDDHLEASDSTDSSSKCPANAGDVSQRNSGDFCRNPYSEICKNANVAPYGRALRNFRRGIRRVRNNLNLATATHSEILAYSSQIRDAQRASNQAEARRLQTEMDVRSWQLANQSLSSELKKAEYGESESQTVFTSVQTALKSAIDKSRLSDEAKRGAKAIMDQQKLLLPSEILKESASYRSPMMNAIFACGDSITCLRDVDQDVTDTKALSYLALKLFCGENMQLDGAVRVPGRGLLLCPGQVAAAKNSGRLNEMLTYVIGHELGHNLTHTARGCGNTAEGEPNMRNYFRPTQNCFARDTGSFNCTVPSSEQCETDVGQKMSELASDIWGSMALAERVSGMSSTDARNYVSKAMVVTVCKNQLKAYRGATVSTGVGHRYTCPNHRAIVVTGQKNLSTATNCGQPLPRACSTE